MEFLGFRTGLGRILLFISAWILYSSFVSATITLPDGSAPNCVNWDGNVVSHNTFTDLDRNDIIRLKGNGYNCLSVDLRAGVGFVWTAWNTFNWTAYDNLVAYLATQGMYVFFQPVWTTSSYYPTFLDSDPNTRLSKAYFQHNFPTTIPLYTQSTQQSLWDRNYLHDQNQWLENVSAKYAGNTTVAGYITTPNEGLTVENTLGLMDVNQQDGDLNFYWQGTNGIQTIYPTIAKLNAAWGTNFAGFSDVNIPINYSNSQFARDWWTIKSKRAIETYLAAEQDLKSRDSTKIIMTVKAHAVDLYPNDSNATGYTSTIDWNRYWSLSSADFISLDPYPSQLTNTRSSNLTLETRYGLASSIGAKYNKAVFIAEMFPTAAIGGSTVTNSQFFNQMIVQSMAYNAFDGNSEHGIKGKSDYTWRAFNDARDIKNSESEKFMRDFSGYWKFFLRYKTNAYDTNVTYYDNTNVNVLFPLSYYRFEPVLWGSIHLARKWTTGPTIFSGWNNYFPTFDHNRIIISNAIHMQLQSMRDFNTACSTGFACIQGFRGMELDENTYSEFGGSSKPSVANAMHGFTMTSTNNNQTFAVRVVDTKRMLTAATDTNIFRTISASSGDFEGGTLLGNGTTDANKVTSTFSPQIIVNNLTLGRNVKINFNLNDNFSNNDFNANMDTVWKDILGYFGIPKQTTKFDNFYLWESPSFVAVNAYGDASQNFTVTAAGKKLVKLNMDGGNDFNYEIINNSAQSVVVPISLRNKQSMVIFKVSSFDVNLSDNGVKSRLYLESVLVDQNFPVVMTNISSSSTSKVFNIDSNVDGNVHNVHLEFTSNCTNILNINFVDSNRDTEFTKTSGWTCNGTTTTFDVNTVQKRNGANTNTLTVNYTFESINTGSIDNFNDGDRTINPVWKLYTDCGMTDRVQSDVNYNGSPSWEGNVSSPTGCNTGVIYTPLVQADQNNVSAYIRALGAGQRVDVGLGRDTNLDVAGPGNLIYARAFVGDLFRMVLTGTSFAGTSTIDANKWYWVRLDNNAFGASAQLYDINGVIIETVHGMKTIPDHNVIFIGNLSNSTTPGKIFVDGVGFNETIGLLTVDVNRPVNSVTYTNRRQPFRYRIYDSNALGCTTFNLDLNNLAGSDNNLLIRHTGITSAQIDANYNLFNVEGTQRVVFTGKCSTNAELFNTTTKTFLMDLNAPQIYLFDNNISTSGWDSNAEMDIRFGCTDTVSTSLNYFISRNGTTLLDNNFSTDTNKNVDTVVVNGVNDLNAICTDSVGRQDTDFNSSEFFVKSFNLVNEETGDPFNLALVSSLKARSLDSNKLFDFKASSVTTRYFLTRTDESIRFDINYLTGVQISREFNLGLLDVNTVRVCVAPPQQLYAIDLTSGSSKGVKLVNNASNCYSLMEYTKYALEGSKVITAYTINAPYYLSTVSSRGTLSILSLIDGSKATTVNLDLIEFNARARTFEIINDSAGFQWTSPTTIQVYYLNTVGDNESVYFQILDDENQLFDYTVSDANGLNPNEVTFNFDFATIDVDENQLTLRVTTVSDSGVTTTFETQFNQAIVGAVGSIDSSMAIGFSLLVVLVGLSILAAPMTFSWFGLVIVGIGALILGLSTNVWYVQFLQFTFIFIGVFIGLAFHYNGMRS